MSGAHLTGGAPETYLVTGGCGFIGRALVRRLAAGGARVIVLDDLSSGSRELLPAAAGIELVVGSVTDAALVQRLGERADAAFHLAGVVGMRLARAEAAKAYLVATRGIETLMQAMGDRPLVAFSSSAVYGIDRADAVSEDDRLQSADALAYDGGRTGYAAGKLDMEQRAAARAAPVLVLRPFNVVGPQQSGCYGMVLPTFIERAAADADLEVHGDGLQLRCFSGVDVAVDCVLRLFQLFRAGRLQHRVFNLGCTRPTTILELARLVRQAAGSASRIRHVPYEQVFPGARDCRIRIPDPSRIEAALGPIRWPGIADIVDELLRLRRAATPAPGDAGAH